MRLERFKERNNKQKSIIIFTIACVMLITGVFLYKTFSSFQVIKNQDYINGRIEDPGDIYFAFYKDNDIVKEVPKKDEGYSLDTSTSKCIDMTTGEQISTVNWDNERWEVKIQGISKTKTKCYLYFKKVYKEEILNGANPDLMNGRLVPVVISETEGPNFYVGNKGGKVTKADITQEWYNYSKQKWANAVILKDGKTDTYKPGQEIPESDIESYFVWIPRYSYKLQDSEETFNSYSSPTDLGTQPNVQSVYEAMKTKNQEGNKAENNGFEIEFGSKDKQINTTLLNKGESIVHPAFTAFDSNGFWVGKFETGYNQNSDGSVMPPNAESWSKGDAEKNTEESTKVIIKPSVYSWRNINVSNAFYTSYNYKRELESHMMKNTEWGAVAYLTQSKYGRCTEEDGKTTCEEVRINNVDTYITGSSAKEEPTCGYTGTKESCNWYETIDRLYMDGGHSNNYYNQESKEASTTGNYSGIYDMSGGAWEYVMGVMQGKSDNSKAPASGRNKDNNSGFKGPYSYCNKNGASNGENCNDNTSNTTGKEWPSSKYYDLYDYSDNNYSYQRGILGDGTKEFGPFYKINSNYLFGSYNADLSSFVNSYFPWFLRGGDFGYGTGAGLEAFTDYSGQAGDNDSFRIILTP